MGIENSITLSVIGGATLSIGGDIKTLRGRKARALFAYLVLTESKSVSRDRLAGLLWEDSDTDKAKSSLRQTVSELRSVFDNKSSCLIIDRQNIGIVSDSVSIDVNLVLADINNGIVPDIMLSRSSITDTILYGFDDIGEGFQKWLQEFRTGIEQKILGGLAAVYKDQTIVYDTRKRMSETALLLDPLQEEACRTLMQLAAQEGDLGTALRAYERLYNTLDEEMGMEPSELTQELAVKIKLGTPLSENEDHINNRPSNIVAENYNRASELPLLAILPVRPLGSNELHSHLPEMLVDDLVCKLATFSELAVISSNSSRLFVSGKNPINEVQSKLGADYFLTGTICDVGETFKLVMQLVDARNSILIWAETFFPNHEDLFQTQSLIAGLIANRLVPSLQGAELRISSCLAPDSMSAYHLILQARSLLFELESESLEQAIGMLELSVKRAPQFTLAYTNLADCYSIRVGQGWSADAELDIESIEVCLQTAINFEAGNSRAIAMLAHNRAIYYRAYSTANADFERAFEKSPNDAETLMWSCPTLAYIGQHDKAIERGRLAISLSPQDPFLFRYQHFLSIAYYAAGQYERALEYGLESQRYNKSYTSNLRVSVASAIRLGEKGLAKNLANEVLKYEPGFKVAEFVRRQAFAKDADRHKFGAELLEAGLPN